MIVRSLATSLVAVACLSGASVASAGARPAIVYHAPRDCPSAKEFESLVDKRLGAVVAPARAGGDLQFQVDIVDGRLGRRGHLRRTSGDGALNDTRVIAGANCAELADALAFTIALSLVDLPAAPTIAAASPPANADQESSPSSSWSPVPAWAVGAGVRVGDMLPPRPLPAVQVFAENRGRARMPGFRLSRPDLRAALSVARNDVLGAAGPAVFTVWTGAVELCPAGAGLSPSTEARFCAVAQAGVVNGEGIAVDTPRAASLLFSAAGALARLRWQVSGRWFVDADAGAVVMLRRPAFVFDMPRISAGASPLVVWSAGLSAGASIP